MRTVAYRKKFVPPSKDQVVAVRHQHYQGEDHPSSRRISIRVPVSALPLKSPEALHKFKLLAGARWHPPLPDTLKHPRDKVGWKVAEGDKDEGLFELSCDVFPYDRMNEKWCSDTLDKLLKEANVRRQSLLSRFSHTNPSDTPPAGSEEGDICRHSHRHALPPPAAPEQPQAPQERQHRQLPQGVAARTGPGGFCPDSSTREGAGVVD